MVQNILEIFPIPAFEDNYIWLIKRGTDAAIVDPGDATPVLEMIAQQSLKLDAILITHHHSDHIGGVPELLRHHQARVFAPADGDYAFPHVSVRENDLVTLEALQLELHVMAVPGHTLDHVAYYGANSIFCGDTLFGAGCGRLFEGTPAQLYTSLQRLAQLPADTAVYCAHEYTEQNIRFARMFDPHNPALIDREQQAAATRKAGKPTLPSSIALELETNPFLRCNNPGIRYALGLKNADSLQTFSMLREKRNHY